MKYIRRTLSLSNEAIFTAQVYVPSMIFNDVCKTDFTIGWLSSASAHL